MSAPPGPATAAKTPETRHREIAIEHLLFGTISFLARRHRELLRELESSLAHLWGFADEEGRDDEAVRVIAKRFSNSLRANASRNA